MKSDFEPRAAIVAALKGACSTKPVAKETILARAKTEDQRAAVENLLTEMISTGEIMHCTVTSVGKNSKKDKVVQTYWPTGIPAKLPYSHGRVGQQKQQHIIVSSGCVSL